MITTKQINGYVYPEEKQGYFNGKEIIVYKARLSGTVLFQSNSKRLSIDDFPNYWIIRKV